ncbi:hypothetical protein B5S28_g1588 [[Candida] boidinii]|nr:hypothetical protein B5S28_g1588 [[Candida] boidinii]
MIIVEGEKYACEQCIRGHRSSTCQHIKRPLVLVRSRGRPINGSAQRIAIFAEELKKEDVNIINSDQNIKSSKSTGNKKSQQSELKETKSDNQLEKSSSGVGSCCQPKKSSCCSSNTKVSTSNINTLESEPKKSSCCSTTKQEKLTCCKPPVNIKLEESTNNSIQSINSQQMPSSNGINNNIKSADTNPKKSCCCNGNSKKKSDTTPQTAPQNPTIPSSSCCSNKNPLSNDTQDNNQSSCSNVILLKASKRHLYNVAKGPLKLLDPVVEIPNNKVGLEIISKINKKKKHTCCKRRKSKNITSKSLSSLHGSTSSLNSLTDSVAGIDLKQNLTHQPLSKDNIDLLNSLRNSGNMLNGTFQNDSRQFFENQRYDQRIFQQFQQFQLFQQQLMLHQQQQQQQQQQQYQPLQQQQQLQQAQQQSSQQQPIVYDMFMVDACSVIPSSCCCKDGECHCKGCKVHGSAAKTHSTKNCAAEQEQQQNHQDVELPSSSNLSNPYNSGEQQQQEQNGIHDNQDGEPSSDPQSPIKFDYSSMVPYGQVKMQPIIPLHEQAFMTMASNTSGSSMNSVDNSDIETFPVNSNLNSHQIPQQLTNPNDLFKLYQEFAAANALKLDESPSTGSTSDSGMDCGCPEDECGCYDCEKHGIINGVRISDGLVVADTPSPSVVESPNSHINENMIANLDRFLTSGNGYNNLHNGTTSNLGTTSFTNFQNNNTEKSSDNYNFSDENVDSNNTSEAMEMNEDFDQSEENILIAAKKFFETLDTYSDSDCVCPDDACNCTTCYRHGRFEVS